MKKFLVTGGAGFIGSHLVDALLDQGHSVVVLDDFSTGRLENIYPDYTEESGQIPTREGLSFVKGSVADQALVLQCLEGVSGCFHLAARLGMVVCKDDWVGTHLINLTATISLFDALQKYYQQTGQRIPVVYASSCAVYGDFGETILEEGLKAEPLSAYGADKLGCELHAKIAQVIYNIPTVGLRFFNVYGPRQRPDTIDSGVIPIFIERIKKGLPLTVYGSGEQTRDFVHVTDVVRHCLHFMETIEHAAAIFNVCTGQATSINQLIKKLEALSGQTVLVERGGLRAGDVMAALGDPKKAKAAGISSLVSFDAGLGALWEFQG